jgi:23S rRNA (guanine745-N1)-methyltransferase
MIGANPGDVVLDAGCGDGFYLGSLARQTGFKAHGVDISIPAVSAAARRYNQFEWIVANADRFIPYADRSFSMVLSITGRMNPEEFRRVLCDDGRVLVALAAPDDLMELRSRTGETGRDRVERTIATFAPAFTLIDRRRVTTTADLDTDALRDILVSIYRPIGAEPTQALHVTFSLDLLLFQAITPEHPPLPVIAAR